MTCLRALNSFLCKYPAAAASLSQSVFVSSRCRKTLTISTMWPFIPPRLYVFYFCAWICVLYGRNRMICRRCRDGCGCLSSEEFLHLSSVVSVELETCHTRSQVHPCEINSTRLKASHVHLMGLILMQMLCNIIRSKAKMNEWDESTLIVLFYVVFSSSGASVVAIDNKIEQAMVSLTLSLYDHRYISRCYSVRVVLSSHDSQLKDWNLHVVIDHTAVMWCIHLNASGLFSMKIFLFYKYSFSIICVCVMCL